MASSSAAYHLVTFVDEGEKGKHYEPHSRELVASATRVGGFQSAEMVHFSSLDSDWREAHAKLLSVSRGHGHFVWKPFMLHERLLKAAEGEVVCYCDSLYTFLADARPVVDAALQASESCSGESSDMAIWHNKPNEPIFDAARFVSARAQSMVGYWHPHDTTQPRSAYGYWTPNAIQTRDTWGGFVCARRSAASLNFVRIWREWAEQPDIISRPPISAGRQPPWLIIHQEDQSVLSLLVASRCVPTHDLLPNAPLSNARCHSCTACHRSAPVKPGCNRHAATATVPVTTRRASGEALPLDWRWDRVSLAHVHGTVTDATTKASTSLKDEGVFVSCTSSTLERCVHRHKRVANEQLDLVVSGQPETRWGDGEDPRVFDHGGMTYVLSNKLNNMSIIELLPDDTRGRERHLRLPGKNLSPFSVLRQLWILDIAKRQLHRVELGIDEVAPVGDSIAVDVLPQENPNCPMAASAGCELRGGTQGVVTVEEEQVAIIGVAHCTRGRAWTTHAPFLWELKMPQAGRATASMRVFPLCLRRPGLANASLLIDPSWLGRSADGGWMLLATETNRSWNVALSRQWHGINSVYVSGGSARERL